MEKFKHPLINCEVELILTWSKNYVLADMTEREAEGDNAGDNRDAFSDCYQPNVEIKNFNILIDGKSFFYLLVKNEEGNIRESY